MKRRYRLGLTAVLGASGIAAVWVLTAFGGTASGPLSSALARLGAAVASAEHGLRTRFGGPGRGAGLEWLHELRTDPARLKDPDVILLGAYDGGIPRTLEGVVQLEQALGTTLPIIQIYAAWGDKPDQQFPLTLLNAIRSMGSIPLVTWEPWLTDFENARHPHLRLRAERDRRGMADVARGDYDFYIDEWAKDAALFTTPIMLRFGHEMNDPYRYPWGPQHNTKEEYIAAWQHVVNRFRQAGANNVVWVWSPHVAYEYWEMYYPGKDYVDWVATGVLNYGPIAQWSNWWSFDQIFGTRYPAMAAFGKPVMIAEMGSLSVGGDVADWYRDALAPLAERYPAVKSVLFFHVSDDQTVTYQKIDWSIVDRPEVAAAIREAISRWNPEPPPTVPD